MRQVPMGFPTTAVPLGERDRVLRVRDHLRYRMEEFLQEGLQVHFGIAEETGAGFVGIRFPKGESDQAVQLLGRHGIAAAASEFDGWLVFYVTEKVSFEDMDYVQGVVTELLYGTLLAKNKKTPDEGGFAFIRSLYSMRLFEVKESVAAGVMGNAAKLFFDSQKLIVLRHAVGTAGCAGFDLSGVEGYGEVGNGGVFSFAGAM